MHPHVREEFERVCRELGAGGDVLEVGAKPQPNTLLCLDSLGGARSKLGINLLPASSFRGFEIVQGNANAMPELADASFDTVLCNAVLEHDPEFWLAIAEMKRVLRPGGLLVLGTPGYGELPAETLLHKLAGRLPRVRLWANALTTATLTYKVHDAPGDYYRFSEQCYREVLLAGLTDVRVSSVMVPPRVVGAGRKPAT